MGERKRIDEWKLSWIPWRENIRLGNSWSSWRWKTKEYEKSLIFTTHFFSHFLNLINYTIHSEFQQPRESKINHWGEQEEVKNMNEIGGDQVYQNNFCKINSIQKFVTLRQQYFIFIFLFSHQTSISGSLAKVKELKWTNTTIT